jgi:hypothetical protein
MTTLQWTFNSRPTAIHAAAGLDAGFTPVDTDLVGAIAQPLVGAVDRLRGLDVDRPTFWQQLIVAAASTDSMAQIVTTAVGRALGPVRAPMVHIELTDLISAITNRASAYLVNPPELELRSQPLQLQWQTYGPGLLRLIAGRTDQKLMVDQARLIVVQAVFGGGGSAHLHANAAHIEAMMVNPDESLPEVLRLAWMISQLHNDLPMFSESINRRQLPTVSGLAMLPATLEAAAELGLAIFNRGQLERAIAAWLTFAGDRALAAEIVDTWWHTARGGGYAWDTALQALDRMLRPLTCAL